MLKIGDFSKINRITIKTLRLYDELNLLNPKYVDKMTGYRYYEPSQLPRIQKIIALKQIGFSLADISSLLVDDVELPILLDRLNNKKSEISKTVELEKNKLQQLVSYIEALKKEPKMTYDVVIKDLPAVTVASMRKVIANYGEYNEFYPQMGKMMEEQKLECAQPYYCFTIYHDGEYKEKDIDVEICESIVKAGVDKDGMTFKQIPAVPQAVCIFHKGPYTNLGKAYGFLMKWVEDNGYEIVDHIRESYHDGVWNKDDPADYLTELQAPIAKKN